MTGAPFDVGSLLQSTLCGANLGTHRFQRAVSVSRSIDLQCASCHSCTLEAMRTQGAFPVSTQTSFILLKALFGATRSNAKKSATHKQIGAAEASSLMDGQVSLTEMDQA
jgi:hypothetical protein